MDDCRGGLAAFGAWLWIERDVPIFDRRAVEGYCPLDLDFLTITATGEDAKKEADTQRGEGGLQPVHTIPAMENANPRRRMAGNFKGGSQLGHRP